MRRSFVALLALALVAAPAVQAVACRCGEEAQSFAAPRGGCCATTREACCCGPEEPDRGDHLERSCPGAHRAPQTFEPPVRELPAPVVAAVLAVAESAPCGHVAAQQVPVARRDPHPGILLPLLI
ncbi:MAG: hypothetical protein ACYTEZ_03035 [Planctomycetota bacterium]|jgi:hypothetical protein